MSLTDSFLDIYPGLLVFLYLKGFELMLHTETLDPYHFLPPLMVLLVDLGSVQVYGLLVFGPLELNNFVNPTFLVVLDF